MLCNLNSIFRMLYYGAVDPLVFLMFTYSCSPTSTGFKVKDYFLCYFLLVKRTIFLPSKICSAYSFP